MATLREAFLVFTGSLKQGCTSKYQLQLFYIQAAKETGALQAAKNKLEKQVEELTWRLQLEKRMRVCLN